MKKPKKRWVEADRNSLPAPSNARLYTVLLTNLRRNGRHRGGTATLARLTALMVAVAKRHPEWVQSPPTAVPMKLRSRPAGPVVLTIWPLMTVAPPSGTRQ